MVLRILHPILLHILPLSAFENAHREPRIREYRTIVDRDRELCTKASISSLVSVFAAVPRAEREQTTKSCRHGPGRPETNQVWGARMNK